MMKVLSSYLKNIDGIFASIHTKYSFLFISCPDWISKSVILHKNVENNDFCKTTLGISRKVIGIDYSYRIRNTLKTKFTVHSEASLKVSISSQVCKNSIPYAWISIRLGWMKIYSQWNTIIFVTCKYCVNSKLRKNQDCLQQNLYTAVKPVISLNIFLSIKK